MRRGVDGRRRELEAALVNERDDRFVLLCEEDDHVHPAVRVDVGRHRVNRARARIHLVGQERRAVVTRRVVLQDREIAGAPPSEGRHRKVAPAVAVEVGGLHIRDTRPAVQAHLPVRPVLAAAQPHHGSFAVIRWQEPPEIADEEVADPVTIQIDRLDVGRVRNARDHT